MQYPRWAIFQILLACFLIFVGQLRAENSCCAHCGCHDGCQKICRLDCEEKKIETVCWGCKTEPFCVPGPSAPGCRHAEMICDACNESGKSGVLASPKKFVWTEWMPGCAQVFTKKKLMKKSITQKVPSYKWVVEDLCERCESSCVGAEIQPGAEIPPPPIPGAILKFGQPAANAPKDVRSM